MTNTGREAWLESCWAEIGKMLDEDLTREAIKASAWMFDNHNIVPKGLSVLVRVKEVVEAENYVNPLERSLLRRKKKLGELK